MKVVMFSEFIILTQITWMIYVNRKMILNI